MMGCFNVAFVEADNIIIADNIPNPNNKYNIIESVFKVN